MLLKTILNRVVNYKPFVDDQIQMNEKGSAPTIEITMRSRENGSPTWTGKFLDTLCTRVMRSKIEPMKKVAKMLRKKRALILNWFVAEGKLSSSVVESFNSKLKLITRKSYGYRNQKGYETALYHTLGNLPEPNFTHKFSEEAKK